MLILEVQHLKKSNAPALVLKNKVLRTQTFDDPDENATLTEVIIPYIYCSIDEELSINIDENLYDLINNDFSIVAKINNDCIDFGWCSYYYEKGEVIEWETRLPDLCCVCKIPNIDFNDDTVEVFVDDTLNFKTTDNIVYKVPILHKIKDFEGLKINPKYLIKGEYCKIYLEKDFPLCIELIGNHVERRYIAPLSC
jgi:hypothetical protein